MLSTAKNRIDFIIAGAQKSGTTALDHYLRTHPSIQMANQKETHYFDNSSHFSHPINNNYKQYHSFFPPFNEKKTGECTPSYLFIETAIARMQTYNPKLKIILILRNPITRAYSHWNMQRDRNIEPLDFLEAIKAEHQRMQQNNEQIIKQFSYVQRGFYCKQIKKLWEYFPPKQCLIIQTNQLHNNPDNTLAEVCNFLNIKPFTTIKPLNIHSRSYTQPISTHTYQQLADIYKNEIIELQKMLNWYSLDWITPGS